MAILLGYTDALDYWRSQANVTDPFLHKSLLGSPRERRSATKSLSARLSSAQSRRETLDYLLQNPASHVITVGNQLNTRRSLQNSHCFKRLPSNSCVRANLHHGSDSLFVSTPEFCFLQMASRLPLEQLIALGFELCGTYAIQPERAAYGAQALTSPAKLATFLEQDTQFKGINVARRALKYIVSGSASPMETNLTMLLSLPYKFGGFGLPRPVLNQRVDIPSSVRSQVESAYFKCDLYWDKAHLAIEYDSDLAHAGVHKTVRDAMRRNALSTFGIFVLSVTRPQVYDRHAFDQLAHLLARKMGRRLRYTDPAFSLKQSRLRDLILYE